MDKKANDTFAFDLENRLDDFFSDSLPPPDGAHVDASASPPPDFPLKDLKSAILAIDWEITDDALDNFILQVDELEAPFNDDKVNQTLLKLLKSLGKYMRAYKSKAHPETIKRIMAVYSALEESVSNTKLGQTEREKMLLEEVKLFKRLKAQIANLVAANATAEQQQAEKTVENSGMEAVIRAIDKLRSMMTAELGAIREELARLNAK